MKKRTNKRSSSLPALLKKWMHIALDRYAAILEESEWFPSPRFTSLP